jgi:signal transduction histidine kinase
VEDVRSLERQPETLFDPIPDAVAGTGRDGLIEWERNPQHGAQVLESLGELAGGIARDFNNLLAVIVNYAAFVAEDLDVAARADVADGLEATREDGWRATPEDGWQATRDDVEQIRLAAAQAARLTHQLLAFARRDAVKPVVVDVNKVVGQIEPPLSHTLGERVELVSSLDTDLRLVLIDPGQLEQMLVNVAINAREAMPHGGTLRIETANVDVEVEDASAVAAGREELSPGPYVRLQMSDTGAGMSREAVQRAFDPSFTTKPMGQGAGLGLAIVYGIVQRAEGRVQLNSELEVGTTFTALLPATDETQRRRSGC